MDPPEISVIVPILDEADNLVELYRELTPVLESLGTSFEVVAVDDGSTDATFERLAAIHAEDGRWQVIRFRKNFGQTAAFAAGFDHARGSVIVTMDADLQNDPADIPRFLEAIESGVDIVSGWRQDRKGSLLLRRLPSFLANRFISSSTGVRLHDYGCSLKAYRADVVENVELYGELHRFIPAIASQYGARITELKVIDRQRRHHRSKYGIGRTVPVMLDLLTVYFLLGFGTRPLRFFGGLGLAAGVLGTGVNVYLSILKLAYGHSIGDRPLLLLGLLLTIVGVQLVAIGLVAELVMRTYYAGSERRPYAIRSRLGGDR
jgi:glycosyltransferase involved in cell wall biosynthesis